MSAKQSGPSEDGEKKETKTFKTKEQKIKFYVTATSIALFFGSFGIFVFLIPFVIDPAVSTLRGDFSVAPAECRIVSAQYKLGVSRCSWSSCREGCTRDIYECHQVFVEYLSEEDQRYHVAQLNINVPGCGYPPEVEKLNSSKNVQN